MDKNGPENGQKIAKYGHLSKNRIAHPNQLVMPFPKMVFLFILGQKMIEMSQNVLFGPFLAKFGPLGILLWPHMTADSGSTHTYNVEKSHRHIDRHKKTQITTVLSSKTKSGQKWTRKMAKNGQKFPPIKKPNGPSKPAQYAICLLYTSDAADE